jgi:hypothetical protein
VVALDHFAGHRRAGRLAPAGQQRLAEVDQAGGVLLAVIRLTAAEQGATALRNGCKQVGEEGVGHCD